MLDCGCILQVYTKHTLVNFELQVRNSYNLAKVVNQRSVHKLLIFTLLYILMLFVNSKYITEKILMSIIKFISAILN